MGPKSTCLVDYTVMPRVCVYPSGAFSPERRRQVEQTRAATTQREGGPVSVHQPVSIPSFYPVVSHSICLLSLSIFLLNIFPFVHFVRFHCFLISKFSLSLFFWDLSLRANRIFQLRRQLFPFTTPNMAI